MRLGFAAAALLMVFVVYGGPAIAVAAAADNQPPTSSISTPAASGAVISGATYVISGGATDASTGGSNVSGVNVSTDGQGSWNAATITGGSGTPTVTWSYSWAVPLEDYVSHTIWSLATDAASNVEVPTSSRQVWVDRVAPNVVSFAVAGGAAYATSTSVTLNNSVTDGSTKQGQVVQMRFSNDGATWSAWESYAATKAWTLTAGDGTKTVYAEFSDVAGNVSAVNDTIILDATPPTVDSITPPGGATGVSVATGVTIVFSEAVDPGSLVGAITLKTTVGAVLVSGRLTIDPADRRIVRFYSDRQLDVSTGYTITAAGTITDLAGNPLGADVTSAFTTSATGLSPHGSYSNASHMCRNCHQVHGAAAADVNYGGKLFVESQETAVCYTCHDGTGASTDVKTVFSLAGSGHAVNDSTTVPGPGLANMCSSCHGAHYAASGAGAKPKLYKTAINGAAVTGNNYTWCEACHNDAFSWVVPTYPYPSGGINAARPVRDAVTQKGYPVLGTFPGRTTYNNTTYNPHNPTTSTNVIWPASGRTSGDCRNCHAPHRNTATYDALVSTFRPTPDAATAQSDRQNGTYALLCITCHDGSPSTRNILQFVSYQYNLTGDDYTGGHRIFTAGGNLPAGAPLPCYDCHNPHGSKGNNGTQPNRKLISDEQWSNIDTTTVAGVVNFCFKCHLPWERVAGSGQALANTIPAGELTTIEGLDRRTAANKLSLITGITAHGEANRTAPSAGCYDCHGNSYATPSATAGFNVHRPARGGSCVGCHTNAQDGGDGAPTRRAIVAEFGAGGRHVRGGTVTDKDCGVCHMEGDAATGSINSTYHRNNAVDFRDPDSGTAIAPGVATFTRNTATATLEAWVTSVENNLCFKCHDPGGAAGAAARVSPGGTALRPFSSNSRDVPNIFDAFNSTNSFHHAVRGAGANPYATPTATNGNVITMVAPWNQVANTHNVISCFDCHIAAGSGHGDVNPYMLRTNVGTIAAPNYTGQRDLCVRCHKTTVYQTTTSGSRFADHKQGQHTLSGGNTYACRGCHAGLVDNDKNTSVANGAPGNIHGGNFTWPTGSKTPGTSTQRYMYGGWLGGWQSGTCYGGNCNHTNGRAY
ncbi:MAG: Ig-like domain-containing protein [Thermoleophilia bacterium]